MNMIIWWVADYIKQRGIKVGEVLTFILCLMLLSGFTGWQLRPPVIIYQPVVGTADFEGLDEPYKKELTLLVSNNYEVYGNQRHAFSILSTYGGYEIACDMAEETRSLELKSRLVRLATTDNSGGCKFNGLAESNGIGNN